MFKDNLTFWMFNKFGHSVYESLWSDSLVASIFVGKVVLNSTCQFDALVCKHFSSK